MLFNKTRQYNIHIFYKIIFFKYRTKQIKAILERYTFIENLMHCLVVLFVSMSETVVLLFGNRVGRKCLFNDALGTFYLWLYGIRHMEKDQIAREETCCHHMGYSF